MMFLHFKARFCIKIYHILRFNIHWVMPARRSKGLTVWILVPLSTYDMNVRFKSKKHTVDGSEIQRSPVEVGTLSTIINDRLKIHPKGGWLWDFWSMKIWLLVRLSHGRRTYEIQLGIRFYLNRTDMKIQMLNQPLRMQEPPMFYDNKHKYTMYISIFIWRRFFTHINMDVYII